MMMALAKVSCYPFRALPVHDHNHHLLRGTSTENELVVGPKRSKLSRGVSLVTASAARIGGFSLNSVFKRCDTCRGQGAIECPGCKGTGKNKKNGNIFERWKCFECQGFGLKSCPECGKGGLTPEQRGER